MTTPYTGLTISHFGGQLKARSLDAGDLFDITPFVSRCDPDFANAVNALWTKTEADWPYSNEGSAIPMPLQGRDSPSCAMVVNWLAQRSLGWFPGASLPASPGEGGAGPSTAGSLPVVPPGVLGFDVSQDDAIGTVPYINPALVKDPECAYIINYCLDHSGGW